MILSRNAPYLPSILIATSRNSSIKNDAYRTTTYCGLLLSDDSREDDAMREWDPNYPQHYNYPFQDSDKSGDRDQRGKEICIDLPYLGREQRFTLTPTQCKDLMLDLWKLLQDAGIEGIGYYPITPHADKRVNADADLFVPFTYQSGNPYDQRLGILLTADDYNQNNYPDPLKDVVITSSDLQRKGIAPIDHKEYENNVRELEKHYHSFLSNILDKLGQIKESTVASAEKKAELTDDTDSAFIISDHKISEEEYHEKLEKLAEALPGFFQKTSKDPVFQLIKDYTSCEAVMNFLKKHDINAAMLAKMINLNYESMHVLFRKIIHCDREYIKTNLAILPILKHQLQSNKEEKPQKKFEALDLAIINACHEIEKLQAKGDKSFLAEVAECLIQIGNNPDVINLDDKKRLAKLANLASGKSNTYKKLAGALMVVAGILAIVGVPFTFGLSGIIGGSIIAACGAGMFYHGRQKSLSKALGKIDARLIVEPPLQALGN